MPSSAAGHLPNERPPSPTTGWSHDQDANDEYDAVISGLYAAVMSAVVAAVNMPPWAVRSAAPW